MPVREMELMQLAGMTNLETIVAATCNGAIVAGLEEQLGTLEVGKTADIVLLSEDPLVDINHMGSIAYVLKEGVMIREPWARRLIAFAPGRGSSILCSSRHRPLLSLRRRSRGSRARRESPLPGSVGCRAS